MSEAMDLIMSELAKPLTHEVRTTYAAGNVETWRTRSLITAENYAYAKRRNIGRILIDRPTGRKVMIVAVEIVEI